jgi:hypothetical protein
MRLDIPRLAKLTEIIPGSVAIKHLCSMADKGALLPEGAFRCSHMTFALIEQEANPSFKMKLLFFSDIIT